MIEILKKIKIAKVLNSYEKETKVIHCGNDETFAFLAYYQYLNNPQTMVIVMENLLACQSMYNKLSVMLKENVYMYCVDEITKFTTLATSPEMESSRLFILNKLAENQPIVVVTHTMAIKRFTPSLEMFNNKSFSLEVDQESSINHIVYDLVKIGYKNVFKVTQPFEFSTRGGVIDIFSINYDRPIRIEFFDTIIESIRFFDEESQRTISSTNKVKIIPACEFLVDDINEGIKKIEEFARPLINNCKHNMNLESAVNEDLNSLSSYSFDESLFKYYSFFDNYSTLADYLKNAKVYVVNENKILDNEAFIEQESIEQSLANYQEGIALKDIKLFERYKNFISEVKHQIFSTDIANEVTDLSFIKVDTFDFNLEMLYKQLMNLSLNHYYIYIGVNSPIHYQSLVSFFNQKDINYHEYDFDKTLKEGINLSNNDLNIGLDFVDYKLYIIGENEIFKKRFKSTISQFSRYKQSVTISSVNDLEIGDYLVHEVYGIGIYKGIETMLNNSIHRDYINIEYKNGDKLYLPLEQFKLVRKYVSKEGAVPKINKLGSKEWEKTKARINERVNEIAERLVNLYSLRAQKEGFQFEKDDDLQLAFENDFGYELTRDQQSTLQEIKNDMEQPYIMDRLLVGDVGFGKTEIAFRAAFKAINSGKQVALLCPTTLLARQHYLTALDRFRNFGVRIRLLSRLVSTTEINQTLKDTISGQVDLLVGTHRLLSSDVIFKDLGLLIVDEEHKFGVEHKEKIKEIKQNVDVLTLSATPIPRTLQMALTGVRGFSTINTPIDNRMPVQTYVIRKEKLAVKEIIERELARGGQVYYLNNKIERLPNIALEIQKLVKNAKVAIAHGKLSVDEMEDIMQRFINQEFNILLCTTIIENGIDIPNVNTIIVENADCFGLSQLYQIKGRVGRSNRLAYAYLMYNPNKELSEIAKKRLQTIKEFTSLGSGYKVAMRDLITRGAGDLLGPEQSGFIETVGIDMYIEMLHNAIDKKRNEALGKPIVEEKIVFNKMLNIDAYIPSKYFNNDYEKIDLYKRIDKVKSFEQLNELKEEMIDKTGKLPESIDLLFEKKIIDLYISSGVIDSYDEVDKTVVVKLSKDFMTYKNVGISIFEIATSVSNQISLKFNHDHIQASIKKDKEWLYILSNFVKKLSVLKYNLENKIK